MSGGVSRFLFDRTKTKPLGISSSCQDRVKDINPANAAILAVYPAIGPSISGRINGDHRRIKLNDALDLSHAKTDTPLHLSPITVKDGALKSVKFAYGTEKEMAAD